jgi:hypothetical protein
MARATVAVAALSFACMAGVASPALAWHLASKSACLRNAHAPQCEAGAVATCSARRSCAIEPHRTVRVCAEWTCRPKS